MVNGYVWCYTTFLKRSGRLLGLELCITSTTLEFTHPLPCRLSNKSAGLAFAVLVREYSERDGYQKPQVLWDLPVTVLKELRPCSTLSVGICRSTREDSDGA